MKIENLHKLFFGEFGGQYVPEMLVPALDQLEEAFADFYHSKEQRDELSQLHASYTGRPSRLYHAKNLTHELQKKHGLHGNAQVYLKLESHNHTGAHKINNVMGQILLAKKMGKEHIVAETGAGQHGLATAAACAYFNMKCTIFMGEIDMQRQYPNVFSMRQMGADVVPVTEGTQTLKDAVNVALKYWVEHVDEVHYLLGSALGPHPYPTIVQYFQSVIGEEVKQQFWDIKGTRPDYVMACVGGGSNALGIFTAFLEDDVSLIGVEAGGRGLATGKHATRFGSTNAMRGASLGIAQGYKSYFLQNEDGQLAETYSISAGLDYAGISPQLAYLQEQGRIEFTFATDEQALEGYSLLSRSEGMIPALETSHALGKLIEMSPKYKDNASIVVNISGRGDKDLFIVAPSVDKQAWIGFLKKEIEKHTSGE